MLKFFSAIMVAVALSLGLPSVNVCAANSALHTTATAAQKPASITCPDERWIISSRHLDCSCSSVSKAALEVLRLSGCEWTPSSPSSLGLDTDPTCITVIYVHGNRIEPNEVPDNARRAFEVLGCSKVLRQRVVYWSWPSDRIPGQVRDVRHKMQRADCDAYYLARFLCRRCTAGPVALVGYSLGARVVVGALHLLGGGQLANGLTLEENLLPPQVRPTVALVAPAIEDESLLEYGEYSQARSQMVNPLILYNSLDPVLRRYWLTDPRRRPMALGFRGTPCCVDWGELRQVDVRDEIGRGHRFDRYFGSPTIVELLRQQIAASLTRSY